MDETPNSSRVSLNDIEGFRARGFPERGITRKVCEFFGVKVSMDEKNNIQSHYYPYTAPSGKLVYKQRIVANKEFFWIGGSGELFGKEKFQSGGKRLVIVEGEIDAMSVAQAFMDKYETVYPVVGLPSATAASKLLQHRDWIRSFDEVVLWFDPDPAGEAALEEARRIVGVDKVKIARSPEGCKDANDVLAKVGWKAVLVPIWDAAPWVPSGIIQRDALWDALVNYNALPSIPYPNCISGLNKKLKGMRLGEIVLFISGTGCLAKDTQVMMFDGTSKAAEDILPGDLLMGDDNTPRTVLNLFRGKEEMVRVTLRDGSYFDCNTSHILSVVNNDNEGRWGLYPGQVVDVSVKEYMSWSSKRKHLSKAFKSKGVVFPKSIQSLDPYVLGAWLGDGYSDGARISSHDDDWQLRARIERCGFSMNKSEIQYTWNSPGGLRAALKECGVLNNKHIPHNYLVASEEQRLELLAGLLDTDGCYDSSKNGYEFSQKSHEFILSVKWLAESLGFACTLGKQKNNKFGNCYRLWINGEGLERIPCQLPRKQARVRQQIKDPSRYSFTITSLGIDDFYGFQLDGNNRFLLNNFIVTHNSGKSTLLREIMIHLLGSPTLERFPDADEEQKKIMLSEVDKIGVVSLEEAPAETARKLSGMALNRNPANEEIPLDILKEGFDAVFGTDRVILLDHQGSISDGSIIDQLEYMILMGCKYLFLDHITILVSEGADGLTGNEAIDKVMNDLLRLVKRHNVWIGLVSHLRKAPSGKLTFEQGQLPTLDDIKGSGAIKQISFDVVGFARNMTAEDEIERNTIKIAALKSRYTGLTGQVEGAFYNVTTGRLIPADQACIDSFTVVE